MNLAHPPSDGKDQDHLVLTFTFRPSAVVSSNSSPSLKEISKFLKEVSVLMLTLSPGALMRILGFSTAARCRMVPGTPAGQTQQRRLGRSANRLLGSNVKSVKSEQAPRKSRSCAVISPVSPMLSRPAGWMEPARPPGGLPGSYTGRFAEQLRFLSLCFI